MPTPKQPVTTYRVVVEMLVDAHGPLEAQKIARFAINRGTSGSPSYIRDNIGGVSMVSAKKKRNVKKEVVWTEVS